MKTSEKQIELKRVGELLRPYYEQHKELEFFYSEKFKFYTVLTVYPKDREVTGTKEYTTAKQLVKGTAEEISQDVFVEAEIDYTPIIPRNIKKVNS